MVVGITGSSGSGKTAICMELMRKLDKMKKDYLIIDADKIVKEMSVLGTEYYYEIVRIFGEQALNNDKTLNRKVIASIIFSNKEKRASLNKITYKYIVAEIKRRVDKNKLTIIDAPLLIESKLNNICNIVFSIIAEKNLKIERISKRDNLSKKEAEARLEAQEQDEFYINNSNYVIINNGTSIGTKAEEIIEIIENSKD